MRIIVAGGGKVGYFLAEALSERHKVSLIERDAARCKTIAEALDSVLVIHGDASDLRVLESAGAEGADVLAAVTGKDEDNLVICQLAKWHCNVKRIVLRASSPKNAEVFAHLKVGATVSGTALIAHVVEEEFSAGDLRFLRDFRRGDMELMEMAIVDGAVAAGKLVRDLGLPKGITLVAVLRQETVIPPNGGTQILSGDSVIAIARGEDAEVLRSTLIGGDAS